MNGISLINERWCIENLSKEESIEAQKIAINMFLDEQKIRTVKLNPYQLNNFYTIPHALLYDLKQKQEIHLDCLVIYSEDAIADFIYSYPAKWLILRSYFTKIIMVEEQSKKYLEEIS